MLIWGKYRYDLVAFAALVAAVLFGTIDAGEAFAGFGHPATVIVALVLVVSRGLQTSGAVDLIARYAVDSGRHITSHIGIMASVGAFLSSFMNNVAALALLMPVDIEAARKAGRSVRSTLMPLSFATILGGLVTLIGTPPNIVIAQYRSNLEGGAFSMFDFAPVGLICAGVGIAFVALIGWRLVPQGESPGTRRTAIMTIEEYTAELVVPENSKAVGQVVRDLYPQGDENEVAILGAVRNGRRLKGFCSDLEVRAGDMLIVEAAAENIDRFRGVFGLEFFGEKTTTERAIGDLQLIEAIITPESRIVGRSAMDLRLRARRGVSLLGVSRSNGTVSDRPRHEKIQVGDVLLMIGPPEAIEEIIQYLRALPLAERGLTVTRHDRAYLASGIFIAAILLATFGVADLTISLSLAVLAYVVTDIVPIRNLYEYIEWPVIVLLGSMIPLGAALEKAGGTQLLAGSLVNVTTGFEPWVILTLLMVLIMLLSALLNNTATAVVGAPIAVDVANRLGANPDPFLMGIAVAASCAFLTPIGHKNNTLIMGPGNYAFGDYWQMGLPLTIIIIGVAVPSLLFFWPL